MNAAEESARPGGFRPPTWAMGLNIGGCGLLGWDNLFSLGPHVSFDLTVGAYPVLAYSTSGKLLVSADLTISPGFLFWFGGRSDQPKGPNRHGMFLAGAYSPYPYPAAGGGIGYAYQRYKNRKHLFTAQVGVSYFDLLPQGRVAIAGYDNTSLHFGILGFMLYWKFSWTWPVVM